MENGSVWKDAWSCDEANLVTSLHFPNNLLLLADFSARGWEPISLLCKILFCVMTELLPIFCRRVLMLLVPAVRNGQRRKNGVGSS